MKKRVYFVRHGESEGNSNNLRGHEDHALTEKGRMQAARIAERCAALPVDALIASTMLRAKDTAGYIAAQLNLPPVYSSLFVEAKGPSEFQNLPRAHEPGLLFDAEMQQNFEDPVWRFSDGENFQDLKDRALAALALLEQHEESDILVVTHGFFMRILVACVVHGPALTAAECRGFIRAFHMENTGLSVFGYDDKVPNPWWVWVWNDHAHLG